MTYTGNMINDLVETVESIAARKAIDELGDSVPMTDVIKRAEEIRDEIVAKKSMPIGGDWFRFLNEDAPDEPDYDRDAEFER